MLRPETMFGIGPGELMVILMILLIAVGPSRMPQLMKAVGRGLREFRKAATELRQQVGIDDLMSEEEWRDPLGLRSSPRGSRARTAPVRDRRFGLADRQREYPPEGVDVRHAAEKGAASASPGEAPPAVPAEPPEDAA